MELLQKQLKDGNKVLDVGSGSGYLTVCFAKMVSPTGKVIGIDHVKDLVNWSGINVRKNHGDLLDSGHVKLVIGDGRQGYANDGPYDAIHVGAAAPTLPQPVMKLYSIRFSLFLIKNISVGRSIGSWWPSDYSTRP